ncbi:MAG: RNA polymerase sigma-70 factor [Tannerella sp.]|jgi:RNA polymerase sigma-70 factor (ECF subfamily)|nr:RNA polymerase sigma-70 factor [Tannerella sp.]
MDKEQSIILLEKMILGDEHALRQLFDMFSHKLFHLAYSHLQSQEVAEEAVLDVFTAIWNKRKSLTHIKNIESYLYISTKNQALQYLRHNAIPDKNRLSLYEIELVAEDDTPEHILLDKEYESLIQAAIDTLPPKCKEVFRLCLSDKLKNREIAKLLSISEKTVSDHLALAYKRIASYVKKRYRQ